MNSLEVLSAEEAEKLLDELISNFRVTGSAKKRQRNYTMALLMLHAGLRVGEVARLPLSSLITQGQVNESVVITVDIAKNKTERKIPMSKRLTAAVESLVEYLLAGPALTDDSYVFSGGGSGQHISTRTIQRIIEGASRRSIGRATHPHVLRHTFATRLIGTVNVRIIQILLGHKSLTSTQIYTHPNSVDLQAAIDKLN